jgi:SAM-dependent methyltransferase
MMQWERMGTPPPEEARGAHVSAANGLRADASPLVRACGLHPEDPIIDVGDALTSPVAAWLAAGFVDITLLDESREALEALRQRLGDEAGAVTLLEMPVLKFRPHRRYALWHDRGVFHRLVHPDDRQAYVEIVQQALRPEGNLVITTFGPQGPEQFGGAPVLWYTARTLPDALGRQFELAEHALGTLRTRSGEAHPLLQCRFRRHAPQWPRGASPARDAQA